MVLYELRGQNYESSHYVVLKEMVAQSGMLDFLNVPYEFEDSYHQVWWEETGYQNARIRDLGGYYEPL